MKKKLLGLILLLVMTITGQSLVFGDMGDLAFFGGISEGRQLPKTTQLLLDQTNTRNRRNQTLTMPYKEVVFLTGEPTECEGLLSVRANGEPVDTEDVGTYTVNYTVAPSTTTEPSASISRTITFDVNWRRVNKQIIKDYKVRTWTETITLPGGDYTLDARQSHFDVSFIEDHTPGVIYSKGNLSSRSLYSMGGQEGNSTILETSGSIYGYSCAWSSTETHRIDASVYTDDWRMQYQVRPSVSVNKTLQYTRNEPTAISFEGNYMEVMQNQSGLEYDIFVKPRQFYALPDNGKAHVPTINTFEQLIAPNVSFLKGHYAEDDIRKLFSMQVLTGDPKLYQPDQAITRGQYVTALVRAIKLPIEETTTTTRNARRQPINIVFPDVQPDNPDYAYIMAAYKAGLAIGRQNGHFYTDAPIERQEALVILMRTLGLETLGLDPTPMTSFTDDAAIASWAKKELYAANRLGIITGDIDGNIDPTKWVSKAEAAAFINLLIDYMRTGLPLDYTQHIVPYAT